MSTTTKQAASAEAFDVPNEGYALEVSTTYPLSEPARDVRARLGRYARYQAQDFLAKQSVAMLVIALALAVPMISVMHRADMPFTKMIENVYGFVAGALIGIGTLLATRGIVSDDTQHGFHRFLFSKPLNIQRYYAQSFGVRFAGFLATLFVLLLPFAFFAAVPLLQTMFVAALGFFVVGGVGFLLSTISRLDTGLLLAVAAVSTFVQGVGRVSGYRWLRALGWLLPPFDQLGRIADYFFNGMVHNAFPLGAMVWALAYGAGCLGAALAILRRRAVSA